MKTAPRWLIEFQENFGALLREPLDARSGTFISELPDAAAARLAVIKIQGLSDYHRQYWFRFFQTMQNEFPLTARLLGLWPFNQLVQEYLQIYPPTEVDLQKITRHFLRFLSELSERAVPGRMLQQAAAIDAARQEVFLASDYTTWVIPEQGLAGDLQLRLAPDVRIIWEDWELVDRVLHLHQFPGEQAIPQPSAHLQPQAWLIQRLGDTLSHRRLPPLQARLYELLACHTLADALDKLQGKSDSSVQNLAAILPTWMSQSVEWGVWSQA